MRRRQSRLLPTRLFFHESYQIQKPLLHLSHGFNVDFRWRNRRRRALVVTQFPQPSPRPLDGKTLPVQQVAYGEQQLNVFAPVETLLGARLLRPDGMELGFPVAQNVRLDRAKTSRLADLEERLVRDRARIDGAEARRGNGFLQGEGSRN